MEKKYYAFISYSRKNSKVAACVHKQLEHFRIPVKYVAEENRPDGQKFLRPVFRDRRDLEAAEGSFTNHIKTALEESRYLIVLCSPESAASHWVNEEIKHFLATHNNNYNAIVPVILNGEPGSGGNAECLPEALRLDEIMMRNLPSMIPDEGDDEKTGWENGVVQAMSYMLKVSREKIKATVDAEKVRQAKIYAVIGVAATIIFALLTAWAAHAERQATFNEQRAIAGEKLAKENEAKAKEQAEIAKRSLSYLSGMFNSANPRNKGHKNITVLELIKNQTAEIENLTPWQLKTAVAREVGSIFTSIGEYRQAEKLLQISCRTDEKEQPSSFDLAKDYEYMAELYQAKNNFDESKKHYHKALKLKLDHYGMDHLETGDIYCKTGEMYFDFGKYDLALENLKKALAIRKKLLPEYDEKLAIIHLHLGHTQYFLGRYKESLQHHKQCLTIRQKIFGNNNTLTGIALGNVGYAYTALGQEEKGNEYFRLFSAINTTDEKDNGVFSAMRHLYDGHEYMKQKNFEKALKAYQDSLTIYKHNFGEKNTNVISGYCNLGNVFFVQQKREEALKYYELSLNQALAALGEQHLVTANSLFFMGTFYMSKDPDTARKYFMRSLNIKKNILGQYSWDIALVNNLIAFTFQVQQKHIEALQYHQNALDINLKFYGEKHRDTALSYNHMASAYFGLKRYSEALTCEEKAVEIAISVLGEGHFITKSFQEQLKLYKRMNTRGKK